MFALGLVGFKNVGMLALAWTGRGLFALRADDWIGIVVDESNLVPGSASVATLGACGVVELQFDEG